MKKKVIYFLFVLCILFTQMPAIIFAADINDLPEPYPQMESVQGIDYKLYDVNGNLLTRQNATGSNTLLIYGRPTCSNTMGFIKAITPWKDTLTEQGLDVIVVFENAKSVKDNDGQIAFTCTYEHNDSGLERFDFVERAGIGYSYTYPLLVLQNQKGEAYYYSTGYVKEPLRVLATAVQELSATEENENNKDEQKPTMKVTASSITLKVKQSTKNFVVTGMVPGDSVKSWKSSDTKVFKVSGKADGTCKLTAQKKAGKATLTIKLKSGLVKKVKVTVQKGTVKTKSIKGVEKKVTLQKGQKLTLKPELNPFTSQEKITYSSSNKKVAKVSKKGVIKAAAPGTAKITVKSGKKKVVCTVKVTKKG